MTITELYEAMDAKPLCTEKNGVATIHYRRIKKLLDHPDMHTREVIFDAIQSRIARQLSSKMAVMLIDIKRSN